MLRFSILQKKTRYDTPFHKILGFFNHEKKTEPMVKISSSLEGGNTDFRIHNSQACTMLWISSLLVSSQVRWGYVPSVWESILEISHDFLIGSKKYEKRMALYLWRIQNPQVHRVSRLPSLLMAVKKTSFLLSEVLIRVIHFFILHQDFDRESRQWYVYEQLRKNLFLWLIKKI